MLNLEDEYVVKHGDTDGTKQDLDEAFSDDFPDFFCVDVIRENDLVDDIKDEEIKTPAINERIVEYIYKHSGDWLWLQTHSYKSSLKSG